MNKKFCVKFLLALGWMVLSGGAFAGELQKADYITSSGTVEFRATGHPSALHVVGKGAGPVGTFAIRQDTVSGSVSFDLQTLDTGISLRDEHMKEKYLEVAKYPQAQLTITELKLPRPLNAQTTALSGVPFQGILKLHGVEKSVAGTVDLKATNPGTLQTNANFSLRLTDFGIDVPKYMGITVADDVQVMVMTSAQLH